MIEMVILVFFFFFWFCIFLLFIFALDRYYQALKDFRQISLNIIAQENKSIDSEAKHAHPKSILSLLLQNQRSADAADQWTEEQLCDEISTFLLAGHEVIHKLNEGAK